MELKLRRNEASQLQHDNRITELTHKHNNASQMMELEGVSLLVVS